MYLFAKSRCVMGIQNTTEAAHSLNILIRPTTTKSCVQVSLPTLIIDLTLKMLTFIEDFVVV